MTPTLANDDLKPLDQVVRQDARCHFGAEALRLEPALATELRVLSVNATAHCDLLFSLPGMFSFNLWTSLPSPTAANVTHWFNLLSPAQQSAVIAQLAAHPRAGLIVERDVLGLITGAGIPVGGPLRDYLYAAFAPAFAAGSHEFWVRRDRSVAPRPDLGTAPQGRPFFLPISQPRSRLNCP